MKNVRLVLKVVGFLLLAFLIFATWYRYTYSMEEAKSFVVNTPESSKTLLIATQGSTFKDSIVSGIISHFRERDLFIQVVDIKALDRIEQSQWDAICLIHTWEYSRPPKAIETFIQASRERERLVVFTTSGDGGFKMEEVDAITGASVMADIPNHLAQLIPKIEEVLTGKWKLTS